jgi:mono/diheme cytochrome c family protein
LLALAAIAWAAQGSSLAARSARVQAPAPLPPLPAVAAADLRKTLDTYCVTCHNQRTKTGNFTLDDANLADFAAHPDVWEKVIRKVRAGMMPPAGMPRPADEARLALVTWLEGSLDRSARQSPNPGRPLAHRLNRTEYANAVRDLLDLKIDAAALLPPDDSSGGFDNNADVLGVSPVLLESYLTAAERTSALAIGDPKTPPMGEVYRVRQDASQDRHVEGLPIGTASISSR